MHVILECYTRHFRDLPVPGIGPMFDNLRIMLRNKWLLSALIVLGLVVLFEVFVAVRRDTALVSALSAAGTVAAGVFAAVAAFGSLRAATASSASVQRASEAMARSVRPSLTPSLSTVDGILTGTLTCIGYAALDVNVAFVLVDGDTVSETVARLAPGDAPLTLTLRSAALEPLREIDLVWLDYTDEGRVGHWRDTWRMGAEPHNFGRLTLIESHLVG
jgi:hypothetical protein